jgi:hypothetical protein
VAFDVLASRHNAAENETHNWNETGGEKVYCSFVSLLGSVQAEEEVVIGLQLRIENSCRSRLI